MVCMLSTIVYAIAALSVAAVPVPNNSKLDVRNIDAKLEARADTLGVDEVVFRRRDDLSMPQIQKREPGTLGLKTIIHAIAHVHPHKAGKAADAASQTQNNGSP